MHPTHVSRTHSRPLLTISVPHRTHRPWLARTASSLLAATLLLALPACSSVPLEEKGAGQAVYQLGDFRMLLIGNASLTAEATRKAFKDLDLFVLDEKVSDFAVSFQARTRQDVKVTVNLTEENSRQTLLSVRWGKLGDKASSLDLYKRIEGHLR